MQALAILKREMTYNILLLLH